MVGMKWKFPEPTITTKKKKKKKKDKRIQLKRDLDKLIQEIYVRKYPRCLVCPNKTSEMHHFIPKSRSLFLRWDERNLIPLCKKCHCSHHFGDVTIHATILKKKGWEWYDSINKDRHKIMKNTLENLRSIEQKLKREQYENSTYIPKKNVNVSR